MLILFKSEVLLYLSIDILAATTTAAPTTAITTAGPQSCALPQTPDVKNIQEQGTRFGLDPGSRFEFDKFAELSNDIRSELKRKWVDTII